MILNKRGLVPDSAAGGKKRKRTWSDDKNTGNRSYDPITKHAIETSLKPIHIDILVFLKVDL